MTTRNTQTGSASAYENLGIAVAIGLVLRLVTFMFSNNTGTDAWARYMASLFWSQRPDHLPSDVWLPLPFWLLGMVLRFWPSEAAARVLTMAFGTITLIPFYGLARKLCGTRFAFYAALVFACLGLHIGYSVSTSSEAPTLLFLITGTYYWLQFENHARPKFVLLSGIAFSAAALCRYEVWLFLVFIALLTAIGLRSSIDQISLPQRIYRVVGFIALASSSCVGWAIFCLIKWGDPMAPAHQTAWLNANQPAGLQPGSLHRILAVPADLLGSLGPIIVAVALIGIVKGLARPKTIAWQLAALALAMSGFHAFNAVVHGVTMARYTLMYSWLFILLGFYGLEVMSKRWSGGFNRLVLSTTIITFLLWQSGVTVGAYVAPCRIADKLGSVSALLPLRCELREAISWLNAHVSTRDSVIVDDLAYESTDIVRFSAVRSLKYFRVPYMASNTESLLKDLNQFVLTNRPTLLVYSTNGQLGRLLAVPTEESEQHIFNLRLRFQPLWSNSDYHIYKIDYIEQPSSKLLGFDTTQARPYCTTAVKPVGGESTLAAAPCRYAPMSKLEIGRVNPRTSVEGTQGVRPDGAQLAVPF